MTLNDLIIKVDTIDSEVNLFYHDHELKIDYLKDNNIPISFVKARNYHIIAYLDDDGYKDYKRLYRCD